MRARGYRARRIHVPAAVAAAPMRPSEAISAMASASPELCEPASPVLGSTCPAGFVGVISAGETPLTGVAVAGATVATGVFVLVGVALCTCGGVVFVATGVLVGGTGVFVGGTGVLVGGTGVLVGGGAAVGSGVSVGCGVIVTITAVAWAVAV